MKFHEFEALRRLTEDCPDQIDFKNAIDREYEIGNSFYEGYRETPFGWLPWLKDEDKSLDVYEAIIREKHIKKWNRQWKINLIEQNNPQWLDLSIGLF